MKTFIINLAWSTGRRKAMTSKLKKLKLDYEFVSAVDGHSLTPADIAPFWDENRTYFRPLKPGEIGCFLSHYHTLGEIVKRKLSHALILEDDIELSPNLPQLLEKLQATIQDGEVYSLYVSMPYPTQFTTVEKVGDYHIVKPSADNLILGAVAYLITYSAAKKMHENLIPIRNVIDDWGWFKSQGFISDFKIVFPHPIDLTDGYSDIHEKDGSFLLKLKKKMFYNNFPIFASWIKHRRRKLRWATRRETILLDGETPKKIFQ